MKTLLQRTLILALYTLQCHVANAQQFAISNERSNVMTLGFANPITVIVRDYECDDVRVEISNGTIRPDSPCRYIVYPENNGKAVISLYSKKDNQLLGISEYRVRWPDISYYIAGRHSGPLKLNYLLDSYGIAISLVGVDVDPEMPIQQFTISIARNGDVIYKRTIKSEYFDQATKDFFKTLKQGDIMAIENISCKWPDGKVRLLSGTEYTITN